MDKLSRKAGESKLGTPSGRSSIRNRAGNGHTPGEDRNRTTFDWSRNAEKRQADWLARRAALNERLARRRRESWRRERNRTDIARAYL